MTTWALREDLAFQYVCDVYLLNVDLHGDYAFRVTDARFSPQGDVIATTGVDRTAQIWNSQDGSLRCTTPPSDGDLLSSGFSHDGQWLVTVSTQGDSRVWTTSNCQLATMLVGQLSKVVAAEFSPDDRLIVTAGSDGSARLFSFPDGVQQAKLLGHRDALTSARFSPDGTTVLTGSNDGTARFWNVEGDRLLVVYAVLFIWALYYMVVYWGGLGPGRIE
jgi:WD40 repeat protein